MAEGTRSGKRLERSDAREKRRALAAKPFEELDKAADAEKGAGGARSTVKQAAATAVAGALAAGVAGAAKALADRREEPKQREPEPEPEPSEETGAEPEDPEPQASGEQVEPNKQEEQEEQDEQPEEQAPEEQAQEAGGVSMSEAKEIVAEAKRELEELLGAEVENVSGFHRSDGRWTVTLEVVKLRRVPETTDVLSSYEVEFDDDRNLVGISETGRYLRSQVQEG